ncbi:MAG TPA: crossover junction endodeoxyribonuclease RuvC [Chloroflexota bacterium]|nr:crossover junction endodeoxyribonuclease RuvC [Chloroflexota bacterium]
MNEEPPRVLGIDPGTAIMGYGIVEERAGKLLGAAHGVLLTPAGEPLPRRLLRLYEGLHTVIRTYQPAVMAIETLFFNRNVRTALAVGQARGVALLVAAQMELPVAEYSPQQVKDAVVGYGAAGKDQVQKMVTTLLGLREVPRPDDAADALAIAICHLHSARLTAMMRIPEAGVP